MSRVVDQPLADLPPYLREREEYWRDLLAELEESELSLSAFARSQDVPPSSMFNWRAEIARRDRVRADAEREGPDPELSFLPVVVREPRSAPCQATPALEVVLSTGRRIRVGADFDASVLTRLVRVLEDLPC